MPTDIAPPGSSIDRSPEPSPARRDDGDFSCTLDYGLLAIDGADAQTFLQGQLSNDVRRVPAGQWQYTTYSSPKGRLLANLVLWPEGAGYRALLPLDIAEPVRKRLAMFVLRSKVSVTDATAGTARVGIAGPHAAALLRDVVGAAPAQGGVLAAGDLRVLGMGPERFIAVGTEAALEAVRPSLAARTITADATRWEWLLIRAGVPTITAPTQDQFVLQTANLDALGAVSFDKGCYTGQEIIARTQYLGRLKERLFAWHARESVGVATKLYSSAFGDQACGTVVNAAPAPQGGTDLLAVVQLAAVDAGDVRVGAPDGAALEPLPLPYALPQPSTPPRRLA